MKRILLLVTAVVRRRVARWAFPELETTTNLVHSIVKDLSKVTNDVLEKRAAGDFTAGNSLAERTVERTEMKAASALFALQDAMRGRPYASRGLNAPGKWAEKNRLTIHR